MSEQYYAAIDLGTNSCRMVIADSLGNYVYNQSAATRLGEGMSLGNCFTAEAINRGITTLKEFGEILRESNCKYRAVATAACRMASNGKEFVTRVKNDCGIELEVIDGHEEARLNLKGALANADKNKPYVVVYDIGGGSTEVTLAKNQTAEIIHTVSVPWGARNASEKYNLNDYDEQKAQTFRNEILKYLDEFKKACHFENYHGKISFVATSSTPLRLSAYIHRRAEYDREKEDGCILSHEEMDKALEQINQTTETERATSIYIGKKRAPIFIAGGILLKTIYDDLWAEKVTASYKSAKDTIIQELIEEDRHGALK